MGNHHNNILKMTMVLQIKPTNSDLRKPRGNGQKTGPKKNNWCKTFLKPICIPKQRYAKREIDKMQAKIRKWVYNLEITKQREQKFIVRNVNTRIGNVKYMNQANS